MKEQKLQQVEPVWECKDCHELIESDRTVAYHLVDRVLYGWCESCFASNGSSARAA
ncbi:MAG TPA: hypothetical protein VFV34_10075 [Blastocatellia bacterium]|nr:hypothetical protein [Blastocatellia bacterium]